MPPSVAQSQAIALPVSAVTTAPPGLAHGLVSKSVSVASVMKCDESDTVDNQTQIVVYFHSL